MLIDMSYLFPCSCCGAVVKPVAGGNPVSLFFCCLVIFHLLLLDCHTTSSTVSCLTCALVNGQPCMIHAVFTYKFLSFCAASHILYVDMHSWMPVEISIASVLRFMPDISLVFVLTVALSICNVKFWARLVQYVYFTGICMEGCTKVTVTVFLHHF